MKYLIFGAAILLASSFPTHSHDFMKDVIDGPTPKGAIQLCEQYEWACSNQSSVYAASFNLVESVNTHVNKSIAPVTDKQQYGVPERWTLPTTGKGDCEDYALQKKYELIQAGVSPNKLFLMVVLDRKQAHTVLVYRGQTTDYILDNMTSKIVEWDDMPYIPVMMQDPENQKGWVIVRSRDRQ